MGRNSQTHGSTVTGVATVLVILLGIMAATSALSMVLISDAYASVPTDPLPGTRVEQVVVFSCSTYSISEINTKGCLRQASAEFNSWSREHAGRILRIVDRKVSVATALSIDGSRTFYSLTIFYTVRRPRPEKEE